MTWSFDITSGPLNDEVWLATKCGKVIRSYWLDKTGRWAGLGTKEQPVAWQLYVVPAHPNSVSDLGLNIVTKHTEISNSKTAAATDIPEARTPLGHIKAVTGKSGAGAVESVCPASIDDVGGGA